MGIKMIKKIFILFIIIFSAFLYANESYINQIFTAIEDNDINYIKYIIENVLLDLIHFLFFPIV